MAVAQLLKPFARERRGQSMLSGDGLGTFRRRRLDVGVILAVFQFHRSGPSKLLHDNIAAAGKFLKRSGDDAA
ncbi:hypothetical protein [uncultured Bradyrhizobium sp.]|uniref:hypothetical protein n=1 Tax=uncultured Bradyrhizobium sp. TaxID=199684 RepID=UPI0026273B66|nr:hypothetical protein [uncultured Bradyrhizobium sp.]